MADLLLLGQRVTELASRQWDREAIERRFRAFEREGLPTRAAQPEGWHERRGEFLDQVQLRGEEYEYLSHNCAKGAALAVMEAFGFGTLETIRALSPFPGLGMTGGTCGAVTGGLIALGLYFGSDDVTDYEATGRTMTAARAFIPRFTEIVGTIVCPEIQEKVIFGRYLDPRASAENSRAFREAGGYEKCALLPGISARIASELILDAAGPRRS